MDHIDIPLIAYGTWSENVTPEILNAIKTSLSVGYRHIDTSFNYNTEHYVVEAILDSGIPRESICLTSKLQRTNIPNNILLNRLGGVKYYDLLLLHYPPLGTQSREEFKIKVYELWIGMVSYLNNGITRSIGVSNFYKNHLELLLEVCDEFALPRPVINQIEIHPGHIELEFVTYMKSQNIIPFAHTPLGGIAASYLLTTEVLVKISNRLLATPAQVVISYLLKRGIGVVTSSKNTIRMIESLNAPFFINLLTEKDIIDINATDIGLGPIIESSLIPWTDNNNLIQ
jgi:diketogulonate reductase-like aldo/keto reductase